MTKLKKIRLARNMTQRELAKALNCTAAAIHRLENIGIRTSRAAKKYANALNCNPLDLLEW